MTITRMAPETTRSLVPNALLRLSTNVGTPIGHPLESVKAVQHAAPSRNCFALTVGNSNYILPIRQDDLELQLPESLKHGLITMLDASDFISPDGTDIQLAGLQHEIDKWRNSDEFHVDFLRGLIFYNSPGSVSLTKEATDHLESLGTSWVAFLPTTTALRSVTAGPHALINGWIRQVWLLHEDFNTCFMSAIEPGTFRQFQGPISANGNQQIPLRPRAQEARGNGSGSLKGWRIAVKDNIQVQGLKTSCGSRAYHDLYPPSQQTARCIQVLIDLGAEIVGKTRLSAFGTWEEPTESIDYQAPWNPRGDGYISPGGSSSGSAAAVASYKWLDVAIGSDTGGSVTRPAHWNGCFGIRPSRGALSAEGLVPSISSWDTPGPLSRDLKQLHSFVHLWYGSRMPEETRRKSFSNLVWCSDYWSGFDENQIALAEGMLRDIEQALGLSCEKVSFQDTWDSCCPSDADGQCLEDYMKDACLNLWYEDYHARDRFREEYQSKFQKSPYVNPPVREDWEILQGVTKDEHEQAVARLNLYRSWFCQHILCPPGQETLLILPIEQSYARYRDETPDFPRGGNLAVGPNCLAAVIGSPQLTVPVGEISYRSKVTGCDEKLPFSVGLMGPPGLDTAVMDAALRTLESSGRPTCMLTGSACFP